MQPWMRSALIVGFAMGGFFDGILLHQILQWHHLLSLVPGVDTLRAQVLWDGLFHAAMYGVAVVGMWGLWRARNRLSGVGVRALAGALLVGSGLWHGVDAVLSHWLLGIHRIRVDSPDPLLWDLLWLVVFGLLPIAAGWRLMRGPGTGTGTRTGTGVGRAGLPLVLAGLLTAGLAGWSLRAPTGQDFTTIVFAPGIDAAQAVAAVRSADGRIVWSDPRMTVIVVDIPAGERMELYRRGALLVSGSGVPSGCFNWSDGVA